MLSVAIELDAADVVALRNDCSSGSRPIDAVVAEARSRSGHDDVRAPRIYGTIAEFMGALGQEAFWNYQTPPEREREKAARRG